MTLSNFVSQSILLSDSNDRRYGGLGGGLLNTNRLSLYSNYFRTPGTNSLLLLPRFLYLQLTLLLNMFLDIPDDAILKILLICEINVVFSIARVSRTTYFSSDWLTARSGNIDMQEATRAGYE